MGYKDASIAKTRWGQIKKKKMGGDAGGGGGGVVKSSPTKVKNTPKKATAGGGEDEGSPRKSGRKTTKPVYATEGDAGEDDVEGEGTHILKKREDSAVVKSGGDVKLEEDVVEE
jgi:hypothetical protein